MPNFVSDDLHTLAVLAQNTAGGDAVFGIATGGGRGIVGITDQHTAVEGNSQTGDAMYGISQQGRGVVGLSTSATGVEGNSQTGAGVWGSSAQGIGVYGKGTVAGYFEGNVEVTGDIKLLNADIAEDFSIVDSTVEPGTVMCFGQEGALVACNCAYDKKAVGVISGAGQYKPGMVLDKQDVPETRMPIALIGKVYCKADAAFGSIEIGDLLTSSNTSGHAMKATDHTKAFGSIIGKSLGTLENGRGLIPILVSLQ